MAHANPKMLMVPICLFIISKTTLAQVNGEFWWLSDKVAKLTGQAPSPPAFEDLSEFDTDESAKIIFRDGHLFSGEDNTINSKFDINHLEFTNIVWPDDKKVMKNPSAFNLNRKPNRFSLESNFNPESANTQNVVSKPSEDTFVFKFPENYNFVEFSLKSELSDLSTSQNNITSSIARPTSKDDSKEEPTTENIKTNIEAQDAISFQFPKNDNFLWTRVNNSEGTKKVTEKAVAHIDETEKLLNDETSFIGFEANSNSESICSFIKKKDCYQMNGIIYNQEKFRVKKLQSEHSHLVCCILPLPTESSKIIFPDSSKLQSRRYRRSNKQESTNPSLAQRDFLLRQRFKPQNVKPTASHSIRVVTPSTPYDDDYVDPYWNVKSSNLKKPGTHSSQKQDCDDPDYVDDYAVELPRPGLVGLYSDNPPRPWTYDGPNPSYGGSFDEVDEDDEYSFGYATIDPRKTSKPPKRGRPVKLTTSSPEDITVDPETQTISFQSNPNFQVLQGFKLLNLGRNKNKFYSKNTRRSTTEASIDIDSKESVKVDTGDDGIQQVYENCGSAQKTATDTNDKQFGEASTGSHPWMALVVLTQKPQAILCYATILHPKAAVTAGNCVYGRTAAKELTLVAGLWNINERSRAQNRFVTATMHPQYRPKILANDLALLHWKTPLRLNANVQPACLGSSRNNDDCKFFGWGGFDQGVHAKPRWQRASILPEQDCAARLSKSLDLPDDGFCATVQTRGTVTGIGGPLICDIDGRKTMTGVSVWRDNALVLIPAHEWILRAFQDLGVE